MGNLHSLRKEHALIDLFCTLAEIPSPSLQEDKTAEKIIEIFKSAGVHAERDSYGNVKAEVPASDKTKKPLLLSAHMDTVGDLSPVHLNLNGDIIETDKTRTLGADDKTGVSASMMLACEISKDKNMKHGGLEIIFTRDEEQNMTGIRNVKMDEIKSEYVCVLDADKLGQVQISGADYISLKLKVKAFKGGHSGIDIGDKSRLNAAKLLSELINEIPQGVYKENEHGTVTSINIGASAAGALDSALDFLSQSDIKGIDRINCLIDKSASNIINTYGCALYSIRSSSREYENMLIDEIKLIIDKFNKKYDGLASAEIDISEHLPPFEESSDKTIADAALKAGRNINLDIQISSFHAGAETHIYANNKNKFNQQFKPVLIGAADIYNMHSSDEKLDYKSFLKGYEFLKELFKVYNS